MLTPSDHRIRYFLNTVALPPPRWVAVVADDATAAMTAAKSTLLSLSHALHASVKDTHTQTEQNQQTFTSTTASERAR